MIDKHALDPVNNLVSTTFDGANNMQGKKTGLGVRIQTICLMAESIHCLCHSASLPVKNLFVIVVFLAKFMELTQDLLKLIKFSPSREHALEELKKNSPPDLMWENPTEAGKLAHWNPTRWTENKRAFIGISNNYDYLCTTFMKHSKSSETSDSVMRSRCWSAANHLSTFDYYYSLCLCAYFLGPLDFLNASMQDPSKSISECMETANKTLKVLETNREDDNFELFYLRCLKYVDIYDCLQPPAPLRRRQRRNYRELQNYFTIDGYSRNDSEQVDIEAEFNGKDVKVKVVINNKRFFTDNEGKLLTLFVMHFINYVTFTRS